MSWLKGRKLTDDKGKVLVKMMSRKDVSEVLGVSKTTIDNLIELGELHAFRVGKRVCIDPIDLVNYIERRKADIELMY